MLYSALAIYTLACPGAAVYKNSGAPGIVQNTQYLAVLKPAPDYISLGWTRMNASREQYAGVAEIPDCRHCRPSSLKGIEQQADGTLNLLVWIQNHPLHRTIWPRSKPCWGSSRTRVANLEKAAEAERRIIEELPQMENEVLHGWARRQQENKEPEHNTQAGVAAAVCTLGLPNLLFAGHRNKQIVVKLQGKPHPMEPHRSMADPRGQRRPR